MCVVVTLGWLKLNVQWESCVNVQLCVCMWTSSRTEVLNSFKAAESFYYYKVYRERKIAVSKGDRASSELASFQGAAALHPQSSLVGPAS